MVLANRLEGVSKEALLDYFISGLKDLICRDVIAQSPSSLTRVASLACLFDERAILGGSSPKPQTVTPSAFTTLPVIASSSPSISTPLPSISSSLPPLLPKPNAKPLPTLKRIPQAEMQLWCEKRLCFTCDDKYTWNHKCPHKQYMLLLSVDNDPGFIPSVDFVDDGPATDSPIAYHLSL